MIVMKFGRILRWLLIIAVIAALVIGALHVKEISQILRNLRQTQNAPSAETTVPTEFTIAAELTIATEAPTVPETEEPGTAEEGFQVENGTINIRCDSEGMFVTQGDILSVQVDQAVLSGQSDKSFVNIVVMPDTQAHITLRNLDLDVEKDELAPILVQVSEGSTLTLELDGENSLVAGRYCAGIEKRGTGMLIISDDSGEAGSLTARGGSGGAGIGGGSRFDCNGLTISGGTIYAVGGMYAAGIGGGSHASGYNITISGEAVINAEGGKYAAGIGGGSYGNGERILFSGSVNVYSAASYTASGIGGGAYGRGKDIYAVENANITAVGGLRTAEYFAGSHIGDGGSNIMDGKAYYVDLTDLFATGSVNSVYGVAADQE
jgi:hypothetical protein